MGSDYLGHLFIKFVYNVRLFCLKTFYVPSIFMDGAVEISVPVFICVRIFSCNNNIAITHSWMSFRLTEEEQFSTCFDGTRQSWFRLFTSRTVWQWKRWQIAVKSEDSTNTATIDISRVLLISGTDDGLFIPIDVVWIVKVK